MPDSSTTAVVFDLGGVVFRYRPDERLAAFAAVSGRPPQDIRKALMDSGYSRSCDAGRLNAETAHREGIRLLGQRMSFENFRARWVAAFDPDPAVVALAASLRPSLQVAMLTNNSDLVRSGLESRHPDVMDLFRPRLFSADVGTLKPDPRLFRTLLDLIGVTPAEVFYVDDEPAYVAAAASLGLQAYLFESAPALEQELRQRSLLADMNGESP